MIRRLGAGQFAAVYLAAHFKKGFKRSNDYEEDTNHGGLAAIKLEKYEGEGELDKDITILQALANT